MHDSVYIILFKWPPESSTCTHDIKSHKEIARAKTQKGHDAQDDDDDDDEDIFTTWESHKLHQGSNWWVYY
jgi:hypothetical protein